MACNANGTTDLRCDLGTNMTFPHAYPLHLLLLDNAILRNATGNPSARIQVLDSPLPLTDYEVVSQDARDWECVIAVVETSRELPVTDMSTSAVAAVETSRELAVTELALALHSIALARGGGSFARVASCRSSAIGEVMGSFARVLFVAQCAASFRCHLPCALATLSCRSRFPCTETSCDCFSEPGVLWAAARGHLLRHNPHRPVPCGGLHRVRSGRGECYARTHIHTLPTALHERQTHLGVQFCRRSALGVPR
jgi:hypothetical protein